MGFFKKKKPYVFPPNIHFIKDGEVVSKVYAEVGEQLDNAIAKAKTELHADGYLVLGPSGRSTYISLERKKPKWGSHK